MITFCLLLTIMRLLSSGHSKVSLKTTFSLLPLSKCFQSSDLCPLRTLQPPFSELVIHDTGSRYCQYAADYQILSSDLSPEVWTPKSMPSRPLYLNLSNIYYVQPFLISFSFSYISYHVPEKLLEASSENTAKVRNLVMTVFIHM